MPASYSQDWWFSTLNERLDRLDQDEKLALWGEVVVPPEFRDEFLQGLLEDARASLGNEPGCLQFDVLYDEAEPTRFFLYEVYANRAALDAHIAAPHLKKFGELIKGRFLSNTSPVGLFVFAGTKDTEMSDAPAQ